jgi:hypothetical protein
MVGDQQDIVSRLKDVLPLRWFPDETPILDGVLNGLAWGWAWCYQLLQFVRAQARLSTAQGEWLDLIAWDYLGARFARLAGQNDDSFRVGVQRELVRERGTRYAVQSALVDLTGREPGIFEPANPVDTGGYYDPSGLGGGCAYGLTGGWGTLSLPFQCFVRAYRPTNSGIALVMGWGGTAGGWGQGAIEYASLTMIQGQITDTDINAAVAGVLPVGTIGWTQIRS